MDPHLLRTFVTVARCRSFSAAARELRYTQSAVSQQIAALEDQVGAELLSRRPVAPTPAGARLLEHAGPILLRLDAARADVARVAGDPPARVSLAASPLAMTRPVAQALAAVEATLTIAGREAVATRTATGGFDVGLVDGVVAPSDPLRLPEVGALTAVRVAEREPVVCLPAGHPLARVRPPAGHPVAGRPGLRLPDLAVARWIDAPEVTVPPDELRAIAGADRWRTGITYHGTDLATLLTLVAAGHGLALLPADLPLPAGVVAVPLVSPQLVHRVEVLHGHLASEAILRVLLGTDTGNEGG